jgi:hypothetical protein
MMRRSGGIRKRKVHIHTNTHPTLRPEHRYAVEEPQEIDLDKLTCSKKGL